jgi:soluble lytic murein transglycosylase-like protein
MRKYRLSKRWISFANACVPAPPEPSRRLTLLWAGAVLMCLPWHTASATSEAQRDPELRAVVQQAIANAECFSDQYDSAVWYKLMEPKLRHYLGSRDERLALLKSVWCESRRADMAPLQPGLVLAVIDVESAFNRWAVSNAGAVGVMQVMPFWPEQLGMRRTQLLDIEPSVRMGCAILRFYLKAEHNDVHRALGRYNGSLRTRDYSNRVVTRWTQVWNGADDLARQSHPH